MILTEKYDATKEYINDGTNATHSEDMFNLDTSTFDDPVILRDSDKYDASEEYINEKRSMILFAPKKEFSKECRNVIVWVFETSIKQNNEQVL